MADGTNVQTTTTAGAGNTGTPELSPEVQKMLTEARTAAMAEVGRVRKTAEEAVKKATDNVTKRFQELMVAQAKDFEEIVKDNPDATSAIRERQKARQAEIEKSQLQAELDEYKAKVTEISQKEAEFTKAQTITEIVASYGVDKEILADLAKFTDGSKEQIENLAKKLPKTASQERPDSNSSRGVQSFTKQQIVDMPVAEYEKNREAILKAQFDGKIK